MNKGLITQRFRIGTRKKWQVMPSFRHQTNRSIYREASKHSSRILRTFAKYSRNSWYFSKLPSKLIPFLWRWRRAVQGVSETFPNVEKACRDIRLPQRIENTLLFEEFWTKERCEEAKQSGRAVSGRLFQYPLGAVVKCQGHPSVSKVRIPDFIERNRALHGDIVCVLMDDGKTTSLLETETLPCETAHLSTESLLESSETDVKDTKGKITTGHVVAIEQINPRSEIFGTPRLEQLRTAKNGNDSYVIFYPRDQRLPPFRVEVEKNEKQSAHCRSISDSRHASTIPRACLEFLNDQMGKGHDLVVAIRPLNQWVRHSRFPDGALAYNVHWRESIVGPRGDFKTESNVCLHVNGLEWREWGKRPELEEALVVVDGTAPLWLEEALKDPYRKDLRSEMVFSIDPENSKDIDDAVHVREVEDGRYHLGIHIADVSYFVKKGEEIDLEARKRICTAYHGDRVLPMLPNVLSTNVCSLLPNKDRLAISILVTLTKDGSPDPSHPPEITRSVIRSRSQLSYGIVEDYIEAKNEKTSFEHSSMPPTICKQIDILVQLTEGIKKRKTQDGFLDFHVKSNYQFSYNKNDESSSPRAWPNELLLQGTKGRSHHLIEQCMILANNIAAEHVLWANARYQSQGIVRIQEQDENLLLEAIQQSVPLPFKNLVDFSEKSITSEEALQLLQNRMSPEAFHSTFCRLHTALGRAKYIPVESSQTESPLQLLDENENAKNVCGESVSRSNDSADGSENDKTERFRKTNVLPEITIEDVQKKLKESKKFRHAQLQLSIYTHFTSPIRRYSDIIVHRILSAAIEGKSASEEEIEQLANVCTHFQRKHKSAAIEFQKTAFNEFLKQKYPEGYLVQDAVVLKIKTSGSLSRYTNFEKSDQKAQTDRQSLRPLPACDVTLSIPEANCIFTLRTPFYGAVIAGTLSGFEQELIDCTLSSAGSVWKFSVGSKCPVVVVPGAIGFHIEMPHSINS